MFVMPRTKHIESRILDLPLPLRPVIELKLSSLLSISLTDSSTSTRLLLPYHPDITVRTAYDLKPCERYQRMYFISEAEESYVNDDLDDPHL